MRHKSFLFQVHRAYENKLDERCEFANAFLGKCWENGVSELNINPPFFTGSFSIAPNE